MTPNVCFFFKQKAKTWNTWDGRWEVECTGCAIRGTPEITKKEAIVSWNTGNWVVVQCSKSIRKYAKFQQKS